MCRSSMLLAVVALILSTASGRAGAKRVTLEKPSEAISFAEAAADSRGAISFAVAEAFLKVENGVPVDAAAAASATTIGEAMAVAYAKTEVILELVEGSDTAGTDYIEMTHAMAEVVGGAVATAISSNGVVEARVDVEALTAELVKAAVAGLSKGENKGKNQKKKALNAVAHELDHVCVRLLVEAVAVANGVSGETLAFVEVTSIVPGPEMLRDGICTGLAATCCEMAKFKEECACHAGICLLRRSNPRGLQTKKWEIGPDGSTCKCAAEK